MFDAIFIIIFASDFVAILFNFDNIYLMIKDLENIVGRLGCNIQSCNFFVRNRQKRMFVCLLLGVFCFNISYAQFAETIEGNQSETVGDDFDGPSIADENDNPITEGQVGGRDWDEEWFNAESVDMGLSVKWGTCNLGAHKSHEIGYYYAWGETEPKDEYSWGNYKYSNGTETSLNKYGWNSSMGIVDNIRKLESSDDACRVKLGSDAHIPTDAEWQELIDNTTQEKCTIEGVDGWLFTSMKNGNSIFFPNGSYRFSSTVDDYYRDQVYCWASTNYNCYGTNGQSMRAVDSSVALSSISRACGLNIRPVFDLDKLSVSATEYDFGTLKPGESKNYVVTVTNNSSEAVRYLVFMASGHYVENDTFSFVGEMHGGSLVYTLQPGESRDFTFVYSPETDYQGEQSSALYLVEVSGTNEKHNITFTGTCLANDSKPDPVIDVTFSTNKLAFGEVEIGKSKNLTFNITNNSNVDVRIDGFGLGSEISLDWNGGVLAVGETKTVTATFTPTIKSSSSSGTMLRVYYGENDECKMYDFYASGDGIEAAEPEDKEPSESQLVVWHKDGSKVMFALSQNPKITMSGEMVKVESTATSMEFEFEAIRKMTYDIDLADNIKVIGDTGNKHFTLSDGSITFLPAERDLNVRIVAINGIVVKEFVVKKDEPTVLPLSTLIAGVYLVNVNGVTYKIRTR